MSLLLLLLLRWNKSQFSADHSAHATASAVSDPNDTNTCLTRLAGNALLAEIICLLTAA